MWNFLEKQVQRWKCILFLKDSNKGGKKNTTAGSQTNGLKSESFVAKKKKNRALLCREDLDTKSKGEK